MYHTNDNSPVIPGHLAGDVTFDVRSQAYAAESKRITYADRNIYLPYIVDNLHVHRARIGSSV